MPTVKHIAKARQRYEMVPVLNEDGSPKTVPVMKDGKPATAKGGREVTRKVTEPDKNKPLPPRHCDYPACQVPDKVIAIGTPFQVISIKRQFGGVEYFRHEACPTWQPWEYSNSLGARVTQLQSMPLDSDGWEDPDDAREAAGIVADAIEELADEKEESADNMESGFGHETEQSTELRETAESLREWAGEVRDVDVPEADDEDEADDEEVKQDKLNDWRAEAEQAVRDAMDNSPV